MSRPPVHANLAVGIALVAALVTALTTGCGQPGGSGAAGAPAGPAVARETTVDPALPPEATEPEPTAATTSTTSTTIDVWATLPPPPAGPGSRLAVVVDRDGSCTSGPCATVLDLSADGRWQLSDRTGAVVADGAYDAQTLIALVADVADGQPPLRLGRFEGECPTTAGGRERLYRLYRPDGSDAPLQELATCHDRIDLGAPVITALDLLMGDAAREVGRR